MEENVYANSATEPIGSPQIPNSQTPKSDQKQRSGKKTQKVAATDGGQCQFNGRDYPSWLGFDPQKPGSAFQNPFPVVGGDHWHGAMRSMNEYNMDVCVPLNDEIQNLLIFSGLFSAVVTAFAIETQKLLQPEPEMVTVLLLSQLNSHFLANTTLTDKLVTSFLNSEPNGQTFRINCLMFSSLVISLGTAFVGIIVLQWVRSLQKVEDVYDRDGVAIREARQKAFETWGVPTIIAYLPVSLGISFIIFLVGLIDFLQSLDTMVARIIGTLVGIIIAFLLLTTFFPALQILIYRDPFPLCAYQSAQSFLICRLLIRSFKSANGWGNIISRLYKASRVEVRNSWLKDALVGTFHRSNSEIAFRHAYLCFQSISELSEKDITLRWNVVSEVIRGSEDLSEIGRELMRSIESSLSSVASGEFFSLLLLLWNNQLGPDYALHRAELNFRCIQTFSSLSEVEYQKLIDLWWRRSARDLSESKQWRPYLTMFLTTLQLGPTLDDIKRPLTFSLFWRLIATRIRIGCRSSNSPLQQNVDSLRGGGHFEAAESLTVVDDCLRVLTTWLLQMQALPSHEYRLIEENQLLRYCLQPIFDYNIFTADLVSESSITELLPSFLNFLDIFLHPNNTRLKYEWDTAIDHAWAEKWDDFLIESNLHLRYHSLLTKRKKKSLGRFLEPRSISSIARLSSVEDNSARAVSPESQLDSHLPPSPDAHPDMLSEVVTHSPTFAQSVSVAPPGSYVSPFPTRPPVVTLQDDDHSMQLHPL